MYVDISERAFEDAIEAGLLQHAQGALGERRSSYLDNETPRLQPCATLRRLRLECPLHNSGAMRSTSCLGRNPRSGRG